MKFFEHMEIQKLLFEIDKLFTERNQTVNIQSSSKNMGYEISNKLA